MEELKNLDWHTILEKLEGFATSEAGRESLRSLKPLSSPEKALESFQKINDSQKVVKQGFRPFMESLDLFSTWYQRIERNAVLKGLELKDVRHFCIETIALKEILKKQTDPWITSINKSLLEASEPLSAIDQIITPEGDIKNDASEVLYQLTKEKNQQIKAIQNTLDKIVKDHDMEGILQDRYVTNREGRWVLPVRSGMQHHFKGIIHAASQSKQTVFMEPQEIIPTNNRLRQIDGEIEKEIEYLLTGLSNYLQSQASQFLQTKEIMHEMDVRLAQAQLAVQLNAMPCEFSDTKLKLEGVKHPLLVLQNEDVVANIVELNTNRRILLLSGPNAGGKTVLLKSIGLAAQMARCGLPICTEDTSTLPFFENFHVAVGDSQSVDAHLSTFAAHLKVLNKATKASGPKELVLIDEICGSTDPEEGTALARSFITAYAEKNVFGIITSHLGELKTGWGDDSGVINGSLEFNDELGPTYQFFMGIPGHSLAIQTAKRVGVDEHIIEKSLKFLSPELKKYHDSLDEVEMLKDELKNIKMELGKERIAANQAKAKYQKIFDKFQKEKAMMLEQSLKRAEKKVDKLIQHAKVDETFKKHSDLQKIKKELPDVIKKPITKSEKLQSILSAEEFTKLFPPGSKVFVPSIGKDAVIQGRPTGKGDVPILSESMRLMVHWEQLKPAQKAVNPTQEVLRQSKHYSVSPTEQDRTVDLRGLNVDEAIEQLELQLDTAALNQEDRVKVIHGHGTDALKRAIRSYLSRSVYVKKWSAGTAQTGGDGMTWVEIKD